MTEAYEIIFVDNLYTTKIGTFQIIATKSDTHSDAPAS